MAVVKCLICGKDLYIKPSHQKLGWGKYCSIACRTKAQLKGKQVQCFICNKDVYRSLKALRSSKSQNFFCSKTCQTIWRNKILYSGNQHTNWKHGKSAYRRILRSTGIPETCKLCKIDDKRIIIVHHLDKNRENNSVENLIWLCQNCHYLVHHFDEAQVRLANALK